MKKFLALAAFVALMTGAAVGPAHAVIVQLWTEASFDGGAYSSNPSYLMYPGYGGVGFSGVTGVFVETNSVFSLGTFQVFGTYGATFETTPDPLPVTVKITHLSDWRNGSGSFAGSLSGSFFVDWSTLTITIPAIDVLLDDYTYHVHGLNTVLTYDPTSVNADSMVTPEPSTLLLVGTGLTGLAGAVRRKLSRRQEV